MLHVSSALKKFVATVVVSLSLFAATFLYAWSPPTQTPPNGNVPAPINVGGVAQVKSGGLSVGRFVVNEHLILAGRPGSTGRYLNFNTTLGPSGYGFRDANGTMQFKNSTDANWKPIQSSLRQIREQASGGWYVGANGRYYSDATVNCNPGYVAVGGGGYCEGFNGGLVSLFSNRPAGGAAWTASCHQDTDITNPGGRGAIAYVVCMAE